MKKIQPGARRSEKMVIFWTQEELERVEAYCYAQREFKSNDENTPRTLLMRRIIMLAVAKWESKK